MAFGDPVLSDAEYDQLATEEQSRPFDPPPVGLPSEVPGEPAGAPAPYVTQGGQVNAMIDAYRARHAPEPPPMDAPPAQPQGMAAPQAEAPQGPAQPHFVPGGWRRDMLPFRPETIDAETSALNRHEGASRQATEAEMQQSDALARFHEQQAARAEERAAAQYQREQEHQAQYKAALQKYNDVVEQAGSEKVDPGRYVRDMDTGSRLLFSVAGVLSGLGSTNGENATVNLIQKNIDRDVRAQEQDLATHKWKAGSQLNMLGELRAQGMDERTASNALENSQWRIAEEQLKAQLAMTTSPIIKARGQEALAQIQDKRVGLMREADQLMYQRPQMVGGVGRPNLNLDTIVKDPTTGQNIQARSEKVAQDLTQMAAELPKIQRMFNEAIAIREKPSWWLDPQDRQRLRTLQTRAAPLISKMGDNSVLRDEEREAMNDSVTAFTSWTPGTSDNLRKTRDDFGKDVADAFKAQAAPVLQTGYMYDRNGNLVRAAGYTGQNVTAKPSSMPSGAKKIGP